LPRVEALAGVSHRLELTLHELLAFRDGVREVEISLKVSILPTIFNGCTVSV